MRRMIPPVRERCCPAIGTQSAQEEWLSLRAPRSLRSGFVCLLLLAALPASAHDLERTHVSIAFARDGSFVVDVANDPNWLALRLESVPGPFADRVVLWVDGREIRPSSVEFLPSSARPDPAQGLATWRLRGRVPTDAHTLRWYYGLVIDPYPLTIRRADGRLFVDEIGGDAWSRTIDLSGQFHAPLLSQPLVAAAIAALLLVPVLLRFAAPQRSTTTKRSTTEDTEDTEVKSPFVQD